MDARGVIFIVVLKAIQRYTLFYVCPSITVKIFHSIYLMGLFSSVFHSH